jgi:8-oxo-dGTP pyrophosphatase MutT (NUDIX family)
MNGNAEILLIRKDGSVILQVRDNKPGITNPGLIASFGGHIEDGEEPIDAAVREINEETNLQLHKDQLEFYRKCHKTREIHGEDWDVYYFAAKNISERGLEVFEGAGYTIIRNKAELEKARTTILLREVLIDYFDGFRSHIFKADMGSDIRGKMVEELYNGLRAGKRPATYRHPAALACTGLVASGKSTITEPLAEAIGAVRISSDYIREVFFQKGYNFKEVRAVIRMLLSKFEADGYNIFLDFNISTNIGILDELKSIGYKIYVVHANPPESFIKNKILSGNMKHELSFFCY